MLVEVRARNMVITDANDARVVRRYIEARKRRVVGPVSSLWRKQRELVTVTAAKHALRTGALPSDLEDAWNEMLVEFVRDDLVPEWIKSISAAGSGIAKKVNRIQRKQFDFSPAAQSTMSWIDSASGTLIANFSASQINAVRALLHEQVSQGVASPYLLAQRIRPIVGLTEKEAGYVRKVMTSLVEEGLPAKIVNGQVERLANTLHRNRAFRIARTELSDAYNFGQLDSVKQAARAGWLPGVPQKSWIAGGPNPCEVCEENEAAGPIPLEDTFPSGDERPTAHPSCACSCSFEVRR